MSARQALNLLRKAARDRDLIVEQVVNPKTGTPRGKGSHEVWVLKGADGEELARGALTKHPGDMSPRVTRNFEKAFESELGEGWMEE